MVSKPLNMRRLEENSNSIPLQNLNKHGRMPSTDSSNGSPNGGDEASQKSLLPKNNSTNHTQGVAIKTQPKSRPPLSNMGFHQPCSIEDDKSYTSIPLSPQSPDSANNGNNANNGMTTLTGTLRRGKKPVQVQLQLTEQEMKALNRSTIIDDDKKGDCIWGVRKGIHIFVLSILYFPFAFISSLFVCFYVGTICWYNIYIHLSEERTIWHKVFICPFLIIFYPFLIVLFSLSLAIFAAFKQLSWYFSSWCKEIKDFDKGFFGAICSKLDIPQCAPYEVVILDEQSSTPASIGDPSATPV